MDKPGVWVGVVREDVRCQRPERPRDLGVSVQKASWREGNTAKQTGTVGSVQSPEVFCRVGQDKKESWDEAELPLWKIS